MDNMLAGNLSVLSRCKVIVDSGLSVHIALAMCFFEDEEGSEWFLESQ